MIVCWWSGGVTSAVACKMTIDKYGKDACRTIILDTGNEHEDTYRFLKDCEKWYDMPIESIKNEDYKNIEETWFRHKSLNTANGAVCSYMLKRRVREKWEKTNSFTHQVFGFEYTKKEINRAKSLELNHAQTNPIFPLIEAKLSKPDCIKIIQDAGIDIPAPYLMGLQNNNCLGASGGCVQGGIGYWKKIQKEMPKLYEKRAEIEHQLTDLKGKPVTMLKDQSKSAKESGNELVFLKKHPDYPELKCLDDMQGRPVKPLVDCNGFCGVNDLIPRDKTEEEINFEGA